MREKQGGKMVNSEGAIGEKDVWGKPAKWVDYSGEVNGQHVGIVIFANPAEPSLSSPLAFPRLWAFRREPLGLKGLRRR